jgi:hypothetical protein
MFLPLRRPLQPPSARAVTGAPNDRSRLLAMIIERGRYARLVQRKRHKRKKGLDLAQYIDNFWEKRGTPSGIRKCVPRDSYVFNSITKICDYLGIKTEFIVSSKMTIDLF